MSALTPSIPRSRPTTRLAERWRTPAARTGFIETAAAKTGWRDLWRLSWPLALAMLLQLSVGLLETWIAGQISSTAQAVVGVTVQVLFLLTTATIALSVGCQALVARMVGAGDWDGASHAVQQTLVLGFWLSLLVVGPLVAFAPALFETVGAGPAIVEQGSRYLRLLALGLVPMNVGLLLNAVLRARGMMRGQLISAGVETAVWIAGSLVFGYLLGGGLAGLAAGFVLGKAAGATMAWRALAGSRLAAWKRFSWRPEGEIAKRILRVGLPTGVQSLVRTAIAFAFYAILGLAIMPNEGVAAYAIGFRLESVGYLLLFALSLAASTVVGQNLGARQPEEAAKACWRLVRLAVALMAVIGAGSYVAAEPLADLFTRDPLVWTYTVDYLRITAIGAPFLALTVVLNGALQGAGSTRGPLVCALLAQGVVGLPLAYGLCHTLGWGPAGVWWGVTGAIVVQGLLVAGWFREGRWKDRRV